MQRQAQAAAIAGAEEAASPPTTKPAAPAVAEADARRDEGLRPERQRPLGRRRSRRREAAGLRLPRPGHRQRRPHGLREHGRHVSPRAIAATALRLAHDLHVKVVGPLDGMKPAALHGGQLAVLLGARLARGCCRRSPAAAPRGSRPRPSPAALSGRAPCTSRDRCTRCDSSRSENAYSPASRHVCGFFGSRSTACT